MNDRTQYLVHGKVWYIFGSVRKGCKDRVNDVGFFFFWEMSMLSSSSSLKYFEDVDGVPTISFLGK